MKTRVFSLLVLCLMLLCTAVSAEDTPSAQRAEKLRALGAVYDLADGESEELAGEVSRGEFAKIIVKYFGKNSPDMEVTEKPYVDVELTNKYVRDIKILKNMGIDTDSASLKYRPDDTVTVGEAGKMLVRAMGYTIFDESKTLGMARSLKLFAGVAKSTDDAATLDDIYKMLENGLDAELFEPVLSSSENLYRPAADKTVLSEYYNIEKRRAIVTANEYTALTAASDAVGEGYIRLGNVEYKLKNTDYGKYLGYTVDYYLDTDEDEVKYITPYKDNKTYEVASDDVDAVTNRKISYTNASDSKKEIKLGESFDVIYNKKAYSGYGNLADIMPEYGSVCALDNYGDGSCEVVFITSYEYYLVKNLYSPGKAVYAYSGAVIDLSDESGYVEIRNSAGGLASFAGIKPDTVISVATSKNSDGDKYIGVIISEKKVQDSLSAADEDEVAIGGKSYKPTKDFLGQIELGCSGTFYLTHDERAAFYKAEGAGEWNVALVYRQLYDWENDDYMVVLYTPGGEFVKLTLAEKAKFAATTQSPDALRGKEYATTQLVVGEVIRYTLDADGKIKEVEVADKGMTVSGKRRYVNKKGLRVLDDGSSCYFRNSIINGKTTLTSDTVYFVVPPTEKWSDKESFYTTADGILLNNIYEYTFPYTAFTFGESDVGTAKVLLLTAEIKSANMSNEAPLYTIDKISTVLRDDDVMTQLVVFGNGAKAVYYCKPEFRKDNALASGDVIQLSADSKKELKAVKKIVNADGSSTGGAALVPGTKNSNGDWRYSGWLVYATVTARGDKFIEFCTADAPTDYYIGNMNYCKYTKLDPQEENRTSVASFDDIAVGDRFTAIVSSGVVRDIVIYK